MNRRAIHHDRRGFALLLVLMIILIVSIIGLTYLSSASVKMISSQSLGKLTRAQHLAESGIQHALYLLQTSPGSLKNTSSSAPLGPYYADDTSDTYKFYGYPMDADGRYVLGGIGQCGQIVKTVTVKVFRYGGKPFTSGNSMIMSGWPVVLPSSVSITGNLLVQGILENHGTITGDISSTWGLWNYGSISGNYNYVGSATVPTLSFSDYQKYNLFGTSYTAAKDTSKTFDSTNVLNNGSAITSSNPAGVVQLAPILSTATITGNVNFKGTIIINGNLILDGANINIESAAGFPALVVTGRIYVTNNCNATIKGVVYSASGIQGYGTSTSSKTTIYGALVTPARGYDDALSGVHKLIYTASRCNLYDIKTGSDSTATVTLTDWAE